MILSKIKANRFKLLTAFFAILSGILSLLLFKQTITKESTCTNTQTREKSTTCDSSPNITYLKPFIRGEKLTTPLLASFNNSDPSNSTAYILTTTLLPGWKYGKYYFPSTPSYYEGYIPTYNILIENINNPDYVLSFGINATEYGYCDFTSNVDEENVFTMNVPTYKEIQSAFGLIRYGKTLPKNEIKPFYIVCQKDVNGKWSEYTGTAVIGIKTPDQPDTKTLNEMINMIKTVKVTNF